MVTEEYEFHMKWLLAEMIIYTYISAWNLEDGCTGQNESLCGRANLIRNISSPSIFAYHTSSEDGESSLMMHPKTSYSRSFMISATRLSGSMMALRETPLMTDSLVRTLMALEEGWNIFKRGPAAHRAGFHTAPLVSLQSVASSNFISLPLLHLVCRYLFERVTVHDKVLAGVDIPTELESCLVLFPADKKPDHIIKLARCYS